MYPRTRLRISQFNSLKRIISQQCYNLFLRSLVKEVGVELSPYQQYYAAYPLASDSKPPSTNSDKVYKTEIYIYGETCDPSLLLLAADIRVHVYLHCKLERPLYGACFDTYLNPFLSGWLPPIPHRQEHCEPCALHYTDAMAENELKGVFDIPIKIIYVVNITIETICAHPTRRLHCLRLLCCRRRLLEQQPQTHLCCNTHSHPHRRYSFVSSPKHSAPSPVCQLRQVSLL